jgi:protein ImuB
LWVAAHLPQLALLALRRPDDTRPLVVVDSDDHHQRLVDADARAQAAGIRPGMTLGAALAAAPDIEPRARDVLRERELMQRLAALAATFTPQVSIEPPDGLLLEIKPSLMLFGGLRELCRRLRDACRADALLTQIGAAPHFTLAPTALAALVAARAGARCFITDPGVLPARLKPLPLAVLRWPAEHVTRLAAMGVCTLGELMRLPRAGFARRFGPELLADLDRLLGKRADPRARLTPRERYRGARDLDHEIEDHERILQVLEPLLAELEQFLRVRQRGITALQCRFHHYRAAPTHCTLRLAAPEASADRFTRLLRERLATLTLPEPVRRCELRAGALRPLSLDSRSLWSPGEHGHASTGEMPSLVEHLRARLGPQALYGIRHVAEHRPERRLVLGGAGHRRTRRGDDDRHRHRPSPGLPGCSRPRAAGSLARPPAASTADCSIARPRAHRERLVGLQRRAARLLRRVRTARRSLDLRECRSERGWFLHGIFG